MGSFHVLTSADGSVVCSRRIAVSGVESKRGGQNPETPRPIRIGSTIPDPPPPRRHHGLSCLNIHRTAMVFDPQNTLEHQRIFLEIGCLARLYPASRAMHVGDANLFRFRVYAT